MALCGICIFLFMTVKVKVDITSGGLFVIFYEKVSEQHSEV